jgi:hypothetical protein
MVVVTPAARDPLTKTWVNANPSNASASASTSRDPAATRTVDPFRIGTPKPQDEPDDSSTTYDLSTWFVPCPNTGVFTDKPWARRQDGGRPIGGSRRRLLDGQHVLVSGVVVALALLFQDLERAQVQLGGIGRVPVDRVGILIDGLGRRGPSLPPKGADP